jgi:hypothetical protein
LHLDVENIVPVPANQTFSERGVDPMMICSRTWLRWSFLPLLIGLVTGFAELPLLHGAVYSAVDDFSLSDYQNVNGVWSYRQGVNSSVFLTNPYSDASVQTWRGSFSTIYGNFPYVAKNVSGGPLPPSNQWTTDLLVMHPSENLTPAVVRWTAPIFGAWRVAGRFQNATSATSDVTIYQNTTAIFASAIAASVVNSVSFDQVVTLSAGDYLEFAVGAQGNWGGDGVGIAAVITSQPAGAVPEPASGMAMALLSVLGWSARNRRKNHGDL